MIQYYYGPDTYGARAAIKEAAKKLNATIKWIDREDFNVNPVGEILGAQGGLFGQTLRVIRDPSTFPKVLRAEVIEQLNTNKSLACILWDRKASRIVKYFVKVANYSQEFKTLPRNELITWVLKKVRKDRGHIDPLAAQMLVERVGTERWRLNNELQRLLLIDSKITIDVIQQNVPAVFYAEIFKTLEYVVSGQTKQAMHNIKALLTAGNSELYILAMLAYQYRVLLTIKLGQDDGLSPGEISSQAKLHPFVVKKSIPFTNRATHAQLLNGFTKIAATDFAIKQGRADPRTALTMLVIGLTEQAASQINQASIFVK